LSGLLAGLGVLVVALASAAGILLPAGRLRSALMIAAVALSPVLILGDQWHSAPIADLRDDTLRIVALVAVALSATTALASTFYRWPFLLPLAIVFALPFRVPLEAGGDTANLLVPLYLVIAAGVLSKAFDDWVSHATSPAGGVGVGGSRTNRGSPAGPPPPTTGPAGLLPWLLAAVVVLYALQTFYSPAFSKGLQNVCFFFVPFALMYGLLRDVEWTPRLLATALWVVALEAVAFVAVGSVEYLTHSLFWNDQVIRSNEFHTYFRVNSVFWDPNIYGRYLALAITIAMAALLWARERRELALLSALVGVLWLGLVPTFSQSSFAALLAGLAVLAALKWSPRWVAAAVGLAAVGGVLVVLLVGSSDKINFSRINIDTSGRANLVSGGLRLFSQRPVYGYGSGSFPKAYRQHIDVGKVPVSVSHTEPITIAAEQGALGLALYLALIVLALWVMLTGLSASRADGAGAGGSRTDRGPPAGRPATAGPARPAVLAAFVALLVHTMAYAVFFEDPITWALLALGVSLAAMPAVRTSP
jgi:O-antigen ligase